MLKAKLSFQYCTKHVMRCCVHNRTNILVRFCWDVDLISRQTCVSVRRRGGMQHRADRVYFGLQSSPDGRPHVVDWNNDVSLHTHTQRENHFTLLNPVLSGMFVKEKQKKSIIIKDTLRKKTEEWWEKSMVCFRPFHRTFKHIICPSNEKPVPHPLVLLCSAEDLRLPNEDVAEGPTAAALLVETGDRSNGETLDHQGLGVR